MKKTRILGLDILRFIAALGILSYHYLFIGPLQGYYSYDIFHPIAFLGEFGVDLFFIISGFVILYSTTSCKTPKKFLLSRAIRIYPAFLLCSAIVLLLGIFMPNTQLHDLLFRWINSFTFFEDLWGVDPLSGVYWTLMVEVKFYVLVAIIMKLKIWEKHKYNILFIWLLISILNTFMFKNEYIQMLFLTKYAGHFVFGILLYLYNKGEKENIMVPLFITSIWLIFRNMVSFTTWVRGLFPNLEYSNVDIFLILLIILGLIYWTSKIVKSKISTNTINLLGAWSFTLYLLHGDFGYCMKTQYYLFIQRNNININVNEHYIMLVIFILVMILSYLVLKLVNKITPMIKKKILKS